MRNPLKLLAISVLAFMSMTAAANYYPVYSLVLFRSYEEQPDHSDRPKTNTHRTPSRPIVCTISETEGIVTDVVIEGILAYELWDADGETCVAEFADSGLAAAYIYAVPGEYQLRIVTSDYSYIGYITTL